MAVYNMYIFNRKGICLYYKEWRKCAPNRQNDAEKERLVFGMLYSLNEIAGKMASEKSGDGMMVVKTNNFTLHQFATASGLRFVLYTDLNVGNLRMNLYHIYSMIFVECVVKSPLWSPLSQDRIDSPLFDKQLSTYVESLPCYR